MNRRIPAAALAGLVLLAGLAWRFVEGQSSPPEADLELGAPMVNVSVPELQGRALQGERLFNANCAACHGLNAAGQEGVAPPLVHPIYEPNHHSDGSFFLAARRGVRAHHWLFGDMPPVPNVSRSDVENIVAYVRTLQRANGIF